GARRAPWGSHNPAGKRFKVETAPPMLVVGFGLSALQALGEQVNKTDNEHDSPGKPDGRLGVSGSCRAAGHPVHFHERDSPGKPNGRSGISGSCRAAPRPLPRARNPVSQSTTTAHESVS